MKLLHIAQKIGGHLEGDGDTEITGLATLRHAGQGDISFLSSVKYRAYLHLTKASAVIITPGDRQACPTQYIVVDDPYKAYAQLARLLAPEKKIQLGVHPSAQIASTAYVDPTAWIGPHCVVEENCVVGAQAQLGPNCVLQRGVHIGADTVLVAQVFIGEQCKIGQRALLHPGVVIGADGFGYTNESGHWIKIPQLGRVQIGDDVEIGANTCIDRGALDDTTIANGVKIDNLVQIAHNVQIGEDTAIAGCAGIAGSAKIGARCAIGGGVGVLGHIEIVNDVVVTGMTFVSKSITEPGIYSSGTPLETNAQWRKNMARMRKLDDLARKVNSLKKLESKKR